MQHLPYGIASKFEKVLKFTASIVDFYRSFQVVHRIIIVESRRSRAERLRISCGQRKFKKLIIIRAPPHPHPVSCMRLVRHISDVPIQTGPQFSLWLSD